MGRPQLLVSVRNPEEALLAVRGGADIVDVKEPSAGPLGMAPLDTLRHILQTFENIPQPPPLSFALGELRDWFSSCPQPTPPSRYSAQKDASDARRCVGAGRSIVVGQPDGS